MRRLLYRAVSSYAVGGIEVQCDESDCWIVRAAPILKLHIGADPQDEWPRLARRGYRLELISSH